MNKKLLDWQKTEELENLANQLCLERLDDICENEDRDTNVKYLTAYLHACKTLDKLQKELFGDGSIFKHNYSLFKNKLAVILEDLGVEQITNSYGKFVLFQETFIRIKKEHEEKVYQWLKERGFGDVIKETVHFKTFESLVTNLLEEGDFQLLITTNEEGKVINKLISTDEKLTGKEISFFSRPSIRVKT